MYVGDPLYRSLDPPDPLKSKLLFICKVAFDPPDMDILRVSQEKFSEINFEPPEARILRFGTFPFRYVLDPPLILI